MKKINYIFALSLLFSGALRADDSELLARLVAATEKSVELQKQSVELQQQSVELQQKLEARLQRVEAYCAMYGLAAQGFFLNMIIPQVVRDKQNMGPQQQKEITEVIKMMSAVVGLTPEQVQESLQE
jgi:hypothetical protein